MSESLIAVRVDDGIGRLRLTRPEKRNAITAVMSAEMQEAMSTLDNDEAVAVIVVEGTDGVFSAGADMTESLAAYEGGNRRFNPTADAAARVGASPKPTIAAIDGPAYGGGASLACACDMRVATDRSRFRFPGADYGLLVGAATLARLIPPAIAKELIFTSRVVEIDEALRLGLVNRVVAPEELDATVTELARQVASGSPLSAAWAKRVIDAAAGGAAAALEAQADLVLRGGPDNRVRFARATERVTGRGSRS